MAKLHLFISLCLFVSLGTSLTFLGSKSFASYEDWDVSKGGTLLLKFKTFKPNGRLLHLQDNQRKVIHFQLSDGKLIYKNTVGAKTSEEEYGDNINDLKWHMLKVRARNGGKVIEFSLDNSFYSETVFHRKFSDCSVFVGGLPSDFSSSLQSRSEESSGSFYGCIDVKFTKASRQSRGVLVKSEGTENGCLDACEKNNPCLNNGKCVNKFKHTECDCRQTGFVGPTCDQDVDDEDLEGSSQPTNEAFTDTAESFTTTEPSTEEFPTTEKSWTENLPDTTIAATEAKSTVRSGPSQCGKKGRHLSHVGKRLRIVGGRIASPGEYPWQVALLYKRTNQQFCGGSLIDRQWVLTAAHCVTIDSWKKTKVRVGEHHLGRRSGTKQDINIAANGVKIHRSYDRQEVDYDIALLKLAQPVRTSQAVNTICLNDNPNRFPVGKKCLITGWGKIFEMKDVGSPVLKEAEVPLIKKSKCKEAYDESAITPRMLCAGVRNGGIDTCQGDSGGPLVCDDHGSWYLTGITSWGEGCGRKGKYGVYSSVAYFNRWIKRNIK